MVLKMLPQVFLTLMLLLSTDVCTAQNSVGDDRSKDSGQIQVGDVAPDWELPGSDGKTYKLADFKGKKMVVIAWYPAALTGG